MGETLGVNTDGMATAASALDGVVDGVKGVYTLAAQQLPDPESVLGDPGKDPIAAAVNENFLPAVGNFLDGLKNLGTVLGQTGAGVGTMVHGFDETEKENADSIRLPGSDSG